MTAEEIVAFKAQGHAVTMENGCLRIDGVDLSHASLSKVLETQPRCCGKCAFRAGSRERSDPWAWIRLVEAFEAGGAFLCHEGIPGHEGQREGVPLILCAGRAALDGKPMVHLCYPAVREQRAWSLQQALSQLEGHFAARRTLV